jgi:hypothetical protein
MLLCSSSVNFYNTSVVTRELKDWLLVWTFSRNQFFNLITAEFQNKLSLKISYIKSQCNHRIIYKCNSVVVVNNFQSRNSIFIHR